MRACVRACVRECVRECVRACVCVCVRVRTLVKYSRFPKQSFGTTVLAVLELVNMVLRKSWKKNAINNDDNDVRQPRISSNAA